jgi:hypothetical protein
LLPELGAARQQHQAKAVAIVQLGAFDLAIEDDELLAEHRVFRVLKSGTVGNSLRVVGGGFGRKNAEVGGQTPRLRPIPSPYPAKTPIQEDG